MRRSSVRTSRTRRGAVAVETAVLLPLLGFIFVIGTDYARAFHFTMAVSNGARNGALYAGSDPVAAGNSTGITTAALQDLTDVTPTPTVTTASGTDAAGNPYIDVTVTYQFTTITNFPGVQNETITRTVRARI